MTLSSKPLHTKMNPTFWSDHGLYRILSSYWLAHFYLMIKSAKGLHCILDWIAGCWNSSLMSRNPEQMYLAAQNFELFSNIKN
jgi:hypothetical protein